MIVCSAGDDIDASGHKTFCKCLCIINDLFLISFKLICKSLFKTYSLCRDHMHKRTALNTREYSFIKVKLLSSRLVGKNQATARTAKCFVCCCCHNVCIWNRTWMKTCSHQTGNMCHIYHQICPHFICHFSEFLEINCSCIGTGTCNN